jgi:hypothetical protein
VLVLWSMGVSQNASAEAGLSKVASTLYPHVAVSPHVVSTPTVKHDAPRSTISHWGTDCEEAIHLLVKSESVALDALVAALNTLLAVVA